MRTKAEELALLSIKKQFDIFAYSMRAVDYTLWTSIIRIRIEKSSQQIMGKEKPCIAISMIGINKDSQCKGLCSNIFTHMENICDMRGIPLYIGEVLSPKLKAILKMRGYKKTGSRSIPSFYRLPKKAEN